MTTPVPTPAHLLPTSCHVCGWAPEHHDLITGHRFWSNAAALAAARDADRRTRVRYPNGTTNPAANYVASYRPY